MQLFEIVLLAVNVNVNASPVSHSPSHLVEKRGAVLSGQFSSEPENNLWGESAATSNANLDLKVGLGHTLGGITSIPTAWSWSYTRLVRATAGTTGASASSTYEVMVWLSARGGATPAGSPVGTVSINGISWRFYKSTVKTWTIFSFFAPSEVTNYNSDLKPFFTYLAQNQGVPSSQFLVQAQAGTEPFVGSATLSTSSYSISINV
ncbi:glycoside hydrolase family 12 protein [Mycena olivaceomarginata]|nr:glycoside hydrolase family 12 protein [Mycena olivaceomarginata]